MNQEAQLFKFTNNCASNSSSLKDTSLCLDKPWRISYSPNIIWVCLSMAANKLVFCYSYLTALTLFTHFVQQVTI